MATEFEIRTTSHFDRVLKKLAKQHPQLATQYASIIPILQADPHNGTGRHPIKKLEGVPAGEGQYRIRARRFRFLKAIRAPLFGLGMACLSQAVLSLGGNPELTLPRWILWCGGGMGLLLASTVRWLFPPLADRPQGAHGPAFWLQQAAEPMQISANAIRAVKGVATITVLALVWASIGDQSVNGRKFAMLALAVLAVYEICKRV